MPRSRWGRGRPGAAGWNANARRAVAVAAAALMLGACGSDTLYDGPTDPGGPGGPNPPPPANGRGEFVVIPGTGRIADLLVDDGSGRVFLSNQGQHRIEVLELGSLTFREQGVRVGSEPWGLALNRTGDTLIVANSGGTNVSFVSTGTLAEDVAKRFILPRVVLYNYTEDDSSKILLESHSYADRPQYVAQDFRGRLLYTARSTAAMPVGTLRMAEWKPGWTSWDTQLLFPCCLLTTNQSPTNRATTPVDEGFAIANVDSISLEISYLPPFAGATGNVIIWDHLPGTAPGAPGRDIRSAALPMAAALVDIHAKGSDVIAYPGANWNIPEASAMADTTFVAVSADRRWVAFAELPAATAGRIIMWSAADSALSRVETIQDLLNNASDRITGVELNANGTLGVARGLANTYFFGRDLRLEGLTRSAASVGRGAALLPGAMTNRTFAFEPTGQNTLRVLETTHYSVVSEIPLRETIAGPFRVGRPRPGTNACPVDIAAGAADCVVATVYGVTSQRRLHVVDVLRRDVM